MSFNYPNFFPKPGYLTNKIKNDYILTSINNGSLPKNALDFSEITSLHASNDPNKPIYFWQLYSILGEKPVEKLIRLFYTRIFNDTENSWFSQEFIEIGDVEYHVRGQKNFWLDVMGGGEHYKGTEKKLHNYHKLVKNIMTQEGANCWMNHMDKALKDIELEKIEDKRVLSCIKSFLNYFMLKYAVEFDFNFFPVMKGKL